MKFDNLKWLLKFKAFGLRCNIFMRMHCNIVAMHAPDHVVVEPHTNILRANLFYFRFFFSETVVHYLKCWLSKRWRYSTWMLTRTKKPLQRELKNIGFDPDWEIDSSLDVIIHYSKKSNMIQKLLKGL